MQKTEMREIKYLANTARRYMGKLTVITAIGTLSSVAGVTFAYFSKDLTDFFVNSQIDGFLRLLPAMIALSLLMIAAGVLLTVYQAKINLSITNSMRQEVFEKLLESDWYSTSAFHSGDLLNRMSRDISGVVSMAIEFFPTVVTQSVQIILAFVLLCRYDAHVAILTVVAVPLLAAFSGGISRRLRAYSRRAYEKYGKNQSFIAESLQNLLVIKTFSIGGAFADNFRNLQSDYYDASIKQTRAGAWIKALMNAAYHAVCALIILWAALRMYNDSSGSFTVGTLVMLAQLVLRMMSPAKQLLSLIPQTASAAASAGRLLELYDIPSETHSDAAKDFVKNHTGSVGIELDNVSFSYDGDRVINDLSLKIAPGEKIAVVGASGEGKTTLIRLLLGLVSPSRGKVCVFDGATTSEVSPDTRALFGYVPQGNSLFSGTVRENLLQGKLDATDDELSRALRIASADFVFEAKNELDSLVNERGGGFSEGQAQRIAIARALLHDAPVLVLDEATSALDSKTEERVLKGIFDACRGKTVIFITHRESTADFCDRKIRI